MRKPDISEEIQHEQAEEAPTKMSGATTAIQAGDEASKRNSHDQCFTWMIRHHLGWVVRIPGQWPRSCSLIFGVIIPLFLLIAVSLFFGFGLAKMEAPVEIEANNDIIANRLLVNFVDGFHDRLTTKLPQICLEIFTQNLTLNETLEEEIDAIFDASLERNSSIITQNKTNTSLDDLGDLPSNTSTAELLDFMSECGTIALKINKRIVPIDIKHVAIGEDLSFNWIRCGDEHSINSSASLLNQIWGRPFFNRTRLKPDVQEAAVVAQWRRHYYSLLGAYGEGLRQENGTRNVEATIQAMRLALEEASGFEHCYPNSAAGAWFWFTVMTTIGYGNTAPSTEGGRAMIYMLGFLSLLLFAIILGTAGTIVVTIWDDFINRTRLHQLNIPWVACIFWGCCYYAWMLVIAAVTQNWKAERLDKVMEFREAYWFAYISTTTVGLGDYYLEHEVILPEDLFTFPLMFLTGFVLLANFFVKLTEVISNLVPRNRPTLEETLATSNAPCLPEMSHARLKALGILHRHSRSGRGADDDGNDGRHDDLVEETDEDVGEPELTPAVKLKAGCDTEFECP